MKSAIAWELGWAIIAVLIIYILASGAKRTIAIGALLVMIPFQIVEHRYGSSSVLMAYALFLIFLVNGGLRHRMLPALGFIAFAYLISMTQADRTIMSWHAISVFGFFSCLVVFILAYNFASLVESERTIVDALLAMNVLVVAYCILQITAGAGERFVPFGIEALAFNSNRDPGDPRLIGPFDSPGVTSTYLMMMIVLCAIELIFSQGRRRLLVVLLVFGNLLALIATANRGAFIVLMVLFPALLFLFRQELGARRVVQYIVVGTLALVIASAIAITYTDFGQLYERMGNVAEVENGVPTGRAGAWTPTLEKLGESPWVGEGPLFLTPEHGEMLGQLRSNFDPYPHSLYLYLIRTVGVVGLIAVVWFFVQVWFIVYAGWKRESVDAYRSAILRFGVLLIPAFLVDQVRLEFNRPTWLDFAQFILAMMGLLVGVADRVGREPSETSASAPEQDFRSDMHLSGNLT